MAVLGLLAAGVLLMLLVVLGWRRARANRPTERGAVTEEQARQNAAPLTTAILSASRTHERNHR